MTKRMILALALLAGLTGCTGNDLKSAYIAPVSGCGYNVRLYDPNFGSDPVLSDCLSLEDATKLAAQINKDMGNKWSGQRQLFP